MQINRRQFLEEGFIVLRNVIPPGHLDRVRAAYENLVGRQRAIWARERKADAPPGGVWEASAQPRLALQNMVADIDRDTAMAIEIWLQENIHGASSRLLGLEDAAVTEMMMMCNPIRDHGPARWHRDFSPAYCAPLQGYVDDILENGPRYVQWNIPLYDDDVLWVVPGSHLRSTSDEEDRQMSENDRLPLASGIQTHLNAGDGVAYILPILHWGSNYSTRKRRTIHGGFSDFTYYPDLGYLPRLSPLAQEAFSRWDARSQEKQNGTVAVLRAAVQKDGVAYRNALDALHPGRGNKGQLQSTFFLSKAAHRIHNLKRPDFAELSELEQSQAASMHPMTLQWGRSIADRFSPTEAAELWARFKPMDDALQAPKLQSSPGFQGQQSRYYSNQLPTALNLEDFIAGWAQNK